MFWPTERQNCFSDQEKCFEIWSIRARICKIFEITRTMYPYPNSERSEQCLLAEWFFFTCFWRFLRFNKLEQLEFKLEKIIGILKHAGKVKKCYLILWYCREKYLCLCLLSETTRHNIFVYLGEHTILPLFFLRSFMSVGLSILIFDVKSSQSVVNF